MPDKIDGSKPAPDLDPEKVKQFQKGFFGKSDDTSSTLDAIKRRMASMMGSG